MSELAAAAAPAAPMDVVPARGAATAKRVSDATAFKQWRLSGAKKDLVAFVARLNASCAGRPNAYDQGGAPGRLAAMLRAVTAGTDRFQPQPGEARRYGSPRFREWHAWLVEAAPGLVAAAVGDATPELAERLCASFGDPTRIDYGTGHELAFVLFLLCCARTGALSEEDIDGGAAARGVFAEYVRTCRVVQTCFGLEPAGSLGVWSLDDYQMLPFVFGAAQLCRRDGTRDDAPSSFGDEETGDVVEGVLERQAESMFFEAVAYVKRCTAHSSATLETVAPVLFNCSLQPWHAINRRLLRLWDDEVLGRQPVVQHVLFSKHFPADWAALGAGEDEEAARLARRIAVMEAANEKLGGPPVRGPLADFESHWIAGP